MKRQRIKPQLVASAKPFPYTPTSRETEQQIAAQKELLNEECWENIKCFFAKSTIKVIDTKGVWA